MVDDDSISAHVGAVNESTGAALAAINLASIPGLFPLIR